MTDEEADAAHVVYLEAAQMLRESLLEFFDSRKVSESAELYIRDMLTDTMRFWKD